MTLGTVDLTDDTTIVKDDVPTNKRYVVPNTCCNKPINLPYYPNREYVIDYEKTIDILYKFSLNPTNQCLDAFDFDYSFNSNPI